MIEATIPLLSSVREESSGPCDCLDMEGMTQLAEAFVPSKLAVICNRSQDAKNHPGNKRFQHVIEKSVTKYSLASTKVDKSLVISDIVDNVRRNCLSLNSNGTPSTGIGAFVRVLETDGRWYDIGDDLARRMVSRCLRDSCCLHDKYRSSSHSKKRLRSENSKSKSTTSKANSGPTGTPGLKRS